MPDLEPESLLSDHEVARLLNISRATLYRMIAAGNAPPSIKLRASRRWRPDAVFDWLEEQEEAAR